jgi:hypothetical protein
MRREKNTDGRPGRATGSTLAACLGLAACAALCVAAASAQSGLPAARIDAGGSVDQSPAQARADDALARATEAVCAERELDPLASVPIDVMQARASLPARNAEVRAGAARAALLLPVARRLAEESLEGLMSEAGIAEPARRAALARVEAVQRIRLEVSLRDNASVVYGDPRTIRFGTIFVASLPSDEGMLSVMAHELTHAADGARGRLSPLFRRVARRAEASAGVGHISARRAEELTCDLVGVLAARLYVEREATDEPTARRAARAVEHNCVEHDETDAEHLSPRQTLRAVLALSPALAAQVTGEAESGAANAPLNHPATDARREEGQTRAPDLHRARREPARRRPPAAL